MSMLQNGLMPSDEILSGAGINHADALAMAEKFAKKSSGSGSSGSSSSSSKSSTGSNSLRETISNVAGGIASLIQPAKSNAQNAKSNAEEKNSIFRALTKKYTK